MSNNIRLAHDILLEKNGECRRSGHCTICDDEKLAAYRRFLQRERRRMDLLSWFAVGVLAAMVALVVIWGAL